VQLTESFKLNTQEIEILRKQNKSLKYENERLSGASEENNNLVKEKVDLAARQSYQLKEVEGHILSFYIMVVHIT
jgi:hypothetical protein